MIVLHILLGILYIGVPLFFVMYYRTYRISNQDDKYFFGIGFLLKILGATAAVLIYVFYYGGGDTTEYGQSGKLLLEYLSYNPDQLLNILLLSDLNGYNELSFLNYNVRFDYWYSKPTYTLSKIALILNAFTLNSFYLTSVLCSYFSFFCSWKFYRFFLDHSHLDRKSIGYAIFFMPSVVFWGSGLFKDTFTLGGLYLLIVGFVNFFGYNKFKLSNILYMIVGVYFLYSIRSFFLMASLPFLILWVISLKYNSVPSLTFRILLMPIFILMTGISLFLIQRTLLQTFQELSFEKLVDTSKGFQSWHTTLKGTAYSLGEIDYTTNALLGKIPASIVVTFYRPFIWEAGKPIILLSALQSLFFLCITIYMIFKMRFIYFLSAFFSSPQAIALMGFSLFYGMVVGFTSYNFGALDRYKIPCLSTYILALIFTLEKYKMNHSNKYSTNG
ncbi:MAG: hypothetical protein ACK567_09755 [Chitinophagales bacterium]